jgi:hypothetical protein
MNGEGKTIICDIDSTCGDHWRRIRRNTNPSWPGGVISHKAWSREEVLQDQLIDSCKITLEQFVAQGFHIRYLTARGWTHARRITIEQLERWQLPNPQDVMITSNMASKVDMLNAHMCNYYIDDFMTGQENAIGTFRSNVATAIQSKGIYVVVFRNDWLDVYEQILLYEKKEQNASEVA